LDLREALACAIENEHKVRDHYAECARRTQNAMGQRVFSTMAQEEQMHVEYLETLLVEWRTTGAITEGELPSGLPSPAWLRDAADKIAASALPPGGSAGNARLPELEFLKAALVLERATSAFYRDMVDQLDPPHQALFSMFLDLEEAHVSLINAEIDALVGHGHWFDFMECP
jgi:rubrerythrin